MAASNEFAEEIHIQQHGVRPAVMRDHDRLVQSCVTMPAEVSVDVKAGESAHQKIR